MLTLFGTGFLMAKYWYFYLRSYYIRKEQDSFRTEMYKGLMDSTAVEIQRCFAQPSIYRLAVHLKDKQYVYFKHGSEKK